MKTIIFAALFALLVPLALYASEIKIESRISSVTVYPDSALITRTSELAKPEGRYTIVFDEILPDIDENSINVSSRGEADARILGVRAVRIFTEHAPSDEINRIQSEIQTLKDELTMVNNHKKLLLDKKNFLDSAPSPATAGHEISRPARMPSPDELGQMMEFLERELSGYYMGTAEADLEIREINAAIEVLARQLAQISGPARKLKRSIAVELEILSPGRAEILLSYLVRGASWRPSYDARAGIEDDSVELISYGNISQRTGEDWENVSVTLSTARPRSGGMMPPVSSWILRPRQPAPTRAAEQMTRKVGVGFESAADSAAPLYAEAVERGTAVNYSLPSKASVKSDGTEQKLPISSQILEAEFEYSSYPAADGSAYLGAMVKNSDVLQLLPGRINIFMENAFSGVSALGNISPGEKFRLQLGLDENVKLSKSLTGRMVDESGFAGITSRTKTTTMEYKIKAENYKSKTVKIKIFEPMPVPEDDRIRVNISKVSVEPSEKDYEDRKGVWLWELEIPSGESKEILYTLSIIHPRTMEVEGL